MRSCVRLELGSDRRHIVDRSLARNACGSRSVRPGDRIPVFMLGDARSTGAPGGDPRNLGVFCRINLTSGLAISLGRLRLQRVDCLAWRNDHYSPPGTACVAQGLQSTLASAAQERLANQLRPGLGLPSSTPTSMT